MFFRPSSNMIFSALIGGEGLGEGGSGESSGILAEADIANGRWPRPSEKGMRRVGKNCRTGNWRSVFGVRVGEGSLD